MKHGGNAVKEKGSDPGHKVSGNLRKKAKGELDSRKDQVRHITGGGGAR